MNFTPGFKNLILTFPPQLPRVLTKGVCRMGAGWIPNSSLCSQLLTCDSLIYKLSEPVEKHIQK